MRKRFLVFGTWIAFLIVAGVSIRFILVPAHEKAKEAHRRESIEQMGFKVEDKVPLPSVEATFHKLTPIQLKNLTQVGKLDVPGVEFARGSSVLTDDARVVLDDIYLKLSNQPSYYIVVYGGTLDSSIEANKHKARERAKVIVAYLIAKGIDRDRIYASDEVKDDTSSVTFVLGQYL